MHVKPVKNVNDFVIGLLLLALGLYIIFTDSIIHGTVGETKGGPFVQPDIYVRLIGGLIAFFSFVLVCKAVNWRGAAQIVPFHFVITGHIIACVASLVVYTILFNLIGFIISTFLLNFFLTCLFLHRERTGEGKPPLTRKDIRRSLIRAAIYSVILVAVIYVLFTYVMFVDLP